MDNFVKRKTFLFISALFLIVTSPMMPRSPLKKMFNPAYKGKFKGILPVLLWYYYRKIPPLQLKHLIALYDGEIRYMDNQLKLLIGNIKKK